MWRKREFYGVIWRRFARVKCGNIMSGFGKCCDCRENSFFYEDRFFLCTYLYICYKLEWQKDLQQTSSHVLLFNTDVSPFGLLQCICKIKAWTKNTQFVISTIHTMLTNVFLHWERHFGVPSYVLFNLVVSTKDRNLIPRIELSIIDTSHSLNCIFYFVLIIV